MAILIHDLLHRETITLRPEIFATDIDPTILRRAKEAVYSFESLASVKFRFINRYFQCEHQEYRLKPDITGLVHFSMYDLLDHRSYAPPESIYGHFDLLLCRNVLMYFDIAHQDRIFQKLYRALAPQGYLVLGEVEIPSMHYQSCLQRVNACCHIYQKFGYGSMSS